MHHATIKLRASVALWAGLATLAVGCGDPEGASPALVAARTPSPAEPAGFSGTESCRECHERFYQLWAPSHHGLAMRPFDAELAAALAEPRGEITVGEYRYRADLAGERAFVEERGPGIDHRYAIDYALGGKNVYYFLTRMEHGRLQVLPVAFDVRERQWFDTTGSMLRMFSDRTDAAVHWQERALTFNTSCYGCHVSQLSTNYDLKTDSYDTVWAEPGINCETCHGPAGEHVRAFREAPEGTTPKDLEIIRTKVFTVQQTNDLCASCHSKGSPVSSSFVSGERYFDHFDLVAYEHADFYPDGRDLGENYTLTSWLSSPCIRTGELDCLHCHTSSGRYRFTTDADADHACLPCHRQRVENAAAHTRHAPDSPGSRCVSCHMPRTVFARMERHDHSMRPPTPATTVAYGSPNACNLCHEDRDAEWADRVVRDWRERDYQAPVLHRAGLIDAARKDDWSRLPAMLDYLVSEDRDVVTATSLVRLLRNCPDPRKWPVILDSLSDESPMMRAAAAEALGANLRAETVAALLSATRDETRVVRIRTAASLAGVPEEMLSAEQRRDLDRAVEEFETAMRSRPDDHFGHYNLGNFYMQRGDLPRAVACFATASRLQPDFVPPLVNASMAYVRMGRADEAEQALKRALEVDPESSAAYFNLGLLLGEQGRVRDAAGALREVLRIDPEHAAAAYNLGVLLSSERLDEAIAWCRKAAELRPDQPKYAFTVAFYLRQSGDTEGAASVLLHAIDRNPAYGDLYLLLGEIYERQGRLDDAAALYRRGLDTVGLSQQDRYILQTKLQVVRGVASSPG